jgi:hypothetical protein
MTPWTRWSPGLQDSLMARLDRSPQQREVAQLGSVLGREFAYEMIRALIGVDEPVLQSGLGQLVVDELLYQRGRPPRSRYLFKHALIQDAAYQSLLKRTRQQYHQQVAKLLEERFPDVVNTQPELLAHHYTEANCPAEAIAYWLKAGAAAAKQSANVEAIDQFGKGLELVAALPGPRERAEQELDLQMALGPALFATKLGSHPDIDRTYARAWELCQQLGDDTRGFTALRGLMLHHLMLPEIAKSQHFAEEVWPERSRARCRSFDGYAPSVPLIAQWFRLWLLFYSLFSASGRSSLATFAAIRLISSRVRLIARQSGTTQRLCRQSGEKRKCATCAWNDVHDAVDGAHSTASMCKGWLR